MHILERLLFVVLLFFSASTFAQKETANWFFGEQAGLNFNFGDVVPITNGALTTLEGCSSISKASGELLFYTDGEKVWNRNNQLMPDGTGLLGSNSATQSALIVPKPSASNIYYIFTSDVVSAYGSGGNGNGINYSIVDMDADSGLGNVIVKNNALLSQGSEKITAVIASNEIDYWLVTQRENKFYSFKVTAAGVNISPVISTVPTNITGSVNLRGAVKISPDGTKIAVCHSLYQPQLGGRLILYDFSDVTGVVSNEQVLADDLIYYGVEFSSNSSKLFASGTIPLNGNNEFEKVNIIQFDLDATNIIASRNLQLEPIVNFTKLAGTLQIGLNRKIYHAVPSSSLSVINEPNLYGDNTDASLFSVLLGGKDCNFGLPPFVQSYFESFIDIKNFCLGDLTEFFLDTNAIITSVLWDFGDPASGAANNSNQIDPNHIYSAPGNYEVTVVVNYQNRPSKEFTEEIEISDTPVTNSDVTLIQCDIDASNDGLTIYNLNEAIPLLVVGASNDVGAYFYLNENDAINDLERIAPEDTFNFENTSAGQRIFVRLFKNSKCFNIEALKLQTLYVGPNISITLDICDTNPDATAITLNIEETVERLKENFPDNDLYLYETIDNAHLEIEKLTGDYTQIVTGDFILYYRTENNNSCTSIGIVNITALQQEPIEDTTHYICPDSDSVILSLEDTFDNYLWSTGETTPSINVFNEGDYEVEVTTSAGCSIIAKFSVETLSGLTNVEVDISDFNRNNTIKILIDNPDFYQYSLDEGVTKQESSNFDKIGVGIYNLQIYKGGCLLYEKTILVGGAAQFFTPNGDGFHDTWKITGIDNYPNSKIFIFDRYGKLLKQMEPNGSWNGTYLGNNLPASDYWYRIELSDGRKVSGNFTLKR